MDQIAIFNFVHLGRVNHAIKTLIENKCLTISFFVNELLALKNINKKLLISRETVMLDLMIWYFETVLDFFGQ